jgi:hypothetical protein
MPIGRAFRIGRFGASRGQPEQHNSHADYDQQQDGNGIVTPTIPASPAR